MSIFLSLLLYCISSKTAYATLDNDAQKDKCLSYKAEDIKNEICCYLEVNTGIQNFAKLKIFYFFPKGVTEKNMKHNDYEVVKIYSLDENTISFKNYKCNKAFYLKVIKINNKLFK